MERPNSSRSLRSRDSSIPTMIFVGQARLPQSLASMGSNAICVELEVHPLSGEIVGLGSAGTMRRCTLLLRDVLLGYDLDRGLEDALHEIQSRYVGPPQKAVCSAVASAYDAFLRTCRRGEATAAHVDGALRSAR
jgi:hypothetical protein